MRRLLLLIGIVLLLVACKKDEDSKVIVPIEIKEITIDDLENAFLPEIELSAGLETVSWFNIYTDEFLYANLSKPLKEEKGIFNNVEVLTYCCKLTELVFFKVNDNVLVDSVKFDFSPTNDTISIDILESIHANEEYELKFLFSYYMKLNETWEKVTLENGIDATTTIAKRFKTSSLLSYIKDCSLKSISIIDTLSLMNDIYPNVLLNYSFDNIFLITKDGHLVTKAKAKLVKSSVSLGDELIASADTWETNIHFYVIPKNIYKENTKYNYRLSVEYEEFVEGQWIPLKDSEGEIIEEHHQLEYTTNVYTSTIPDKYINVTYPLQRQFNFYIGEYSKGYIEFIVDPVELPQIENVNEVQFRFMLLPDSIIIDIVDGLYEQSENTIWFDIPKGLQNEKPYSIQMLSNDKVIYSNEFRVSKYQYISEKLPLEKNVRFLYDTEIEGSRYSIDILGVTIYSDDDPDEYFDYYETQGLNESMSLIKISALLEQWDWYQQSVYQYIYSNHPVVQEAPLSRLQLGEEIPPSNYFKLWQKDYDRKLSDSEISSGQFNYTADKVHLVNSLPELWAQDYLETQNALRSIYTDPNDIDDLVQREIYSNEGFPSARNGDYSIQIDYVLPGKGIITSSQIMKITNSIYSN